SVEFEMLRKGASPILVSFKGKVAHDDQGRFKQTHCTFTDITETRRMEEALARTHETAQRRAAEIEAFYSSAPVGLCVLDRDLRYVQINERLANMNGRPVAEHIGRTVRGVVPTMADPLESICRRCVETGQPVFNVEATGAPDPLGVSRRYLEHFHPLRNTSGEVVGVNVVVQDITERERAEEALRASEERLRLALKGAQAGAWERDMRTQALVWSPENYDLYGIDPPERRTISYQDWACCLHPDDLAPTVRAMQDVIEHRTSEYRAEFRVNHPKRGERWILGIGQVERCPDNEPVRVLGINIDITDRKRMEAEIRRTRDELELRVQQRTAELERANHFLLASEKKYRTLVDTLSEGVAAYDEQGNLTYVNRKFCEILGYSQEEVIGRCVADFLNEEARPLLKEQFERRERSEQTTWEIEQISKDGRRIPSLMSVSPLLDEEGNFTGGISAITDVTTLKRSERELRLYAAKLERLNREVENFSFIAAHDLQEPLRKIQMFSSMIGTRFHDHIGEEGNGYLDRISASALRMSNLIKSLFSYTRLSSHPETQRTISLTKAAREAVTDLDSAIAEAGGTVTIGNLPEIEADPKQMSQLFFNLIENSIKFRSPDDMPLVKIHEAETVEEGICRIVVEDNGIGFDERYADLMFKPFQKLHGKERGQEGTGIGLALCRKIVDRHGGTITAGGEIGRGATFTITLPLRQTPFDL
ncbi:MAG: PAS domain S-box protein, partial [Acidobacteriota bacterium]